MHQQKSLVRNIYWEDSVEEKAIYFVCCQLLLLVVFDLCGVFVIKPVPLSFTLVIGVPSIAVVLALGMIGPHKLPVYITLCSVLVSIAVVFYEELTVGYQEYQTYAIGITVEVVVATRLFLKDFYNTER